MPPVDVNVNLREGVTMLDVPDRSATAGARKPASIGNCRRDGTRSAPPCSSPRRVPADAPLIVIGRGAGVPSRYYARFAAYLAERGHPC